MLNFCTLFNSNYLSRGIAMYESLMEYCDDFHLYIFSFDDKSLNILKKLNLEKVTVISLKEFETEALLNVKKLRTAVEYCWTCTPFTILYCIQTFKLDMCTYLDADLYFYSSPKILIDELKDSKSVLITNHRYTKKYDLSYVSGIFCVQFVPFKNDDNGLKVLKWWCNACLNWCYAKFEDGKFGDQKYLDKWPETFECVHILENLGGGVAPWNIQQYDFYNHKSKIIGIEKKTQIKFELVFYHFHFLKILKNDTVDLGRYKTSNEVIEFIYKPYVTKLENIKNKILKLDKSFDPHGAIAISNENNLIKKLKSLKRTLKGINYVYSLEKFIEKK